MKLYIIRHGETDLNKKAVMQGCMDAPLNEKGVELAEITGRAMKGIRFDRCISSPLIRAVDTAKLVLRESGNGDIEVETDDRIREISFGVADGMPLASIGEQGKVFFNDPFGYTGFEGGETIRQVCDRTQEFLKELIALDDGKTYLIAIHGCAVRAMLNFLYDDPTDYWHGHVPYNCAVNIIEAEGGKAVLTDEDKLYYPHELAVDRYAGKRK